MARIGSVPVDYAKILQAYRVPLLLGAVAVFCFGLWKVRLNSVVLSMIKL